MAASALEQPFHDAIKAEEIDGVVMEGRAINGAVYSRYIGVQVSPDGTSKPLTSSSLPYMASATKLLATVAALQLVDQNQLSLDEDLRTALPKLTSLGVLTAIDEDEEGQLKATTTNMEGPLTLRHMLTHSAGMDYFFLNPVSARYRAAHPPPKPAPNAMERFLMPAMYQPGEGWMYGQGMDFAAYLIEQKTGERFDESLRDHVFGPVAVGRNDVSFFPIREGLGDRMPDLSPQDPEGLGLAAVRGINFYDGGDVCYGGHGAYVTAPAYVAVLESIMQNDEKLLSREAVAEMFRPQLAGMALEAFQSALDGPVGPAFGNGTDGKDRNMGLGGLLVGEEGDGGLGKGSYIWGGGLNTTFFIDPQHGICGIVSPQMRMPSDAKVAMELKTAFRENLGRVLKATKTSR